MPGLFEPFWDGDWRSPCPPLPIITGNYSTGDQLNQARAHFMCKYAEARSSSEISSTAEWNRVVGQGDAWIRAQLAKYVNTAGMTNEALQRVRELAAADPTLLDTTPQIQPHQSVLNTASAVAAPAPVLATPVGGSMVGVSSALNLGSILTTGIGIVTGGPAGIVSGVVGGITDLLSGGGKSKCPGPYNYNPVTGGCDPKPGNTIAGPVSGGPVEVYKPPATTSPGVTTPAEYGLGGYVTGMDDWGRMYAEPRVATINVHKCPPGAILGANGLCYAKGSGVPRKWKKAPRPVLTAGDARTLRKIHSIQKRVRKAASLAGFTAAKKGACRTPPTRRKR